MNNRTKTKTLVGNEAREAILKGIQQVYEPVAATIGAKGRNAVFDDWGAMVTNDGVTIARKINPEDSFEALGADLIKQSAEKTNEEAGDGTTTTIILAQALITRGFEQVSQGKNPMVIRKELMEAKDKAIEILKSISRPVDNLFDVAKISVEDEKIAKIVSEAVEKAGKNGSVIVEESNGYDIEKEEVQGYFFDRGFISPYMVTNPDKMEAVLNDAVVIVTDRHLNLNKELMGCLSEIHQSGKNNVLLICENLEGELMQSIIANKMKGLIITVVVRRPGTLEELEDIAVLTDSTAVTDAKGIKEIKYIHLGKAKRVVIKRNQTIIVAEPNEKLTQRIADLEKEVLEDPNNELLKSRLAKLVSGVVILRVGAKTEAERRYLKLKVDDAVGACRAAQEEGIVEGGGVSLLTIADKLGDGLLGEALKEPYNRILANAGIENDGRKYNVLTGDVVKDMFEASIVDPTKVERCSIENACSLAGTVLTIESATVQIDKSIEGTVV